MNDERGWVIERYINSELHYWDGRGRDPWTPKHEDAIRLARQQDAEMILSWQLNGQGRTAEHTWMAKPPR